MEDPSLTELMAYLLLQLGIILFAVRFFGSMAKRVKIPPVLGELLAGMAIGPYALGGIRLPGLPEGVFPLGDGPLAVSTELYAFATVASIILLFAAGLETNIKLFLRYSLAGGIISLGGVLASFVAGDLVGTLLFKSSFLDPRCLFMGILCTANSLGIIARILSDQKKIDSPEGVTILAASAFDDVWTIIALTVVLGIIAIVTGTTQSASSLGPAILIIAGKTFAIWLGCTALGLIFAKNIAGFFKLFKSTFDFSVLALGFALILAGIFEKSGLSMIIGAYIAGLALSKTDIAPVIQECVRGIYGLFVPIFFAVMGMMVDFRHIISPPVLTVGGIYAAAVIVAKLIGCGGPAMLLGFNAKGALRIGLGMAPRGEMTLIIAGIGLSMGILNPQLSAVLFLMILITSLVAPSLLSVLFKVAGPGTRKPVKAGDSVPMTWEFPSSEIAGLVINTLLKNLRNEGFYIQVMHVEEGLSQARKDDISLTIREHQRIITIEVAETDTHFVKTAVYEVIVELHESIRKLIESSDPQAMKKDLLDSNGCADEDLLSFINLECISFNLKGQTKEQIITEMVDLLAAQGRLPDRDMVLADVFERERTMETGMEHGVALPHAKTDGVNCLEVALGIKKEGIDFGAIDGEKSRLFILIVSPKNATGPHISFLAGMSALLIDEDFCEELINAASPDHVLELLRTKVKSNQLKAP
jgi:Kef-type K+ transport system membrane component KefB/mannitol/fructose-specific phosphotransferase system IIA component (Ntr-type)